MEFVTHEWENGPTSKRDLNEPAKIKKDPLVFTLFGAVFFVLFIIREMAAALWFFLWRLISRPEPKSLKGKVCLVTGAGRGLGREFCLALAREGAILACVDINEPNNNTTAAMVEELGAKAVPFTVNVAVKKDVEDLVSRVEEELGPIYLLINNAAIVYTLPRIDEEFIRAVFNVNLFGPIWMMNAVLPGMKMRNEGHIVNISSIASKMVISPLNVYGTTKISLAYFSNCIRAELEFANKNNIFVTNVHQSIMNSSEDYVRWFPMKINIAVEMEEVVQATMNAIYYNYDEVVVPSIMKYPLILVTEMMPSQTGTKLMKLIFHKWSMPSEEQYKFLPWSDIVKESCFTEKKKGC